MGQLEAQLGQLEAQIGQLEAQMGQLEAQMGQLEAQMDQLEAQMCLLFCLFSFPLRGRNDLSRRVDKGFDWIQEKKKISWRRETEQRRIL